MAYGRQRAKHHGQLPLIELGTGSYRHKIYGEVMFPTFKIVDWQSETSLIAGQAGTDTPGAGDAPVIDDEIPF